MEYRLKAQTIVPWAHRHTAIHQPPHHSSGERLDLSISIFKVWALTLDLGKQPFHALAEWAKDHTSKLMNRRSASHTTCTRQIQK